MVQQLLSVHAFTPRRHGHHPAAQAAVKRLHGLVFPAEPLVQEGTGNAMGVLVTWHHPVPLGQGSLGSS